MNPRNRKKNPRTAGASKGGKSLWKSIVGWATLIIVGVAIGAVIYAVTSPGAQTEEEPVVTESRSSPEPPDTAVRPEEERQTEIQVPEAKEVVTTPTTSPPTTVPEPREPDDGQEAGTEEESEVPTSPASHNVFGNGENLVIVQAYSLGCPACAEYHPILKQIREEYEDQITFQVVHFPLAMNFGNSLAAHQAAEAAARQGKFWQMHDILFERRDLWTASHTEQPLPQFEIFAEEIGLDLEQFRQDFRSTEVGDVIDEDERYLASLGVTATPTFFLNGQQIAGNKLAGVELARQALNEVLGIEPEEEAAKDPEEGSEGGEPEGGSQEPKEGQKTSDEGKSEGEAVEDPEEGSEGGEPEEGEEADIPDPVRPNQAWLSHIEEVERLLHECGYYSSENSPYGECDDPEDGRVITQMISDFLGCDFDSSISRCEGYGHGGHWALESRLACPEGWFLGRKRSENDYAFTCYHPDHPDYIPM